MVGFRSLITWSWTRAQPCTVASGENEKEGEIPACLVRTSAERFRFPGAVLAGLLSLKHSGPRFLVGCRLELDGNVSLWKEIRGTGLLNVWLYSGLVCDAAGT